MHPSHSHHHPSSPSPKPAEHPGHRLLAAADREVAAAVDQALGDLLRMDPVLASRAGFSAHDGAFSDRSVAGRAARRHTLTSHVHALARRGAADPVVEDDRLRLLAALRVALRCDEDLDPSRRNPAAAVEEVLSGLVLLLRPPLAPRLGALLGRLREVERTLSAAAAALNAEEVPRPFAELAIAMARQGLTLLTERLPLLVHGAVGETPLAAAIGEAAGAAALALATFANRVESEVLPRAEGDLAAGASLYEFLLHQHGEAASTDALSAAARDEAEAARVALADLAAQVAPGRHFTAALRALEDETYLPDEDTLVAVCEGILAELRRAGAGRFPEGASHATDEALLVAETPACFRGVLPFAAYQPPLAAPGGPLTGVLWVTPGNRVTRQELLLTCAHEGYPGHHLHAVHAVGTATAVGRVLPDARRAAGWALYVESLLPTLVPATGAAALAQALLIQRGRLWRALRVELDIALHCQGLPLDQVAARFAAELHFGAQQAHAEALRLALHPTRGLSYQLGARDLFARRAAAESAGSFDERHFHAEALSL